MLENPDFTQLYESRYNPKIEIEKLRELAPGTFGRAVAEFLDQHGFEPNAFPWGRGFEAGVSRDFAFARFMISGTCSRATTRVSKVSWPCKASRWLSSGTPFSALLLAGGMLHLVIYRPMDLFRTFEGVIDGFLRGKQSQNLITLRIEDLWSRSLQQVRSELLGESGQLRKISFAIDPLESERGRLVN